MTSVLLFSFSFFLWSISHPGKNGHPTFDLSKDKDATVSSKELTSVQLSLERVITKVFCHYAIPIDISNSIRTTFKSKLWRMGKALSKLGGKKRPEQLRRWKEGPESVWNFTVNEAEVSRQLLKRKRQVEVQLEQQVTKRRKLEKEVNELKRTTRSRQKQLRGLRLDIQIKAEDHHHQRCGPIIPDNIDHYTPGRGKIVPRNVNK